MTIQEALAVRFEKIKAVTNQIIKTEYPGINVAWNVTNPELILIVGETSDRISIEELDFAYEKGIGILIEHICFKCDNLQLWHCTVPTKVTKNLLHGDLIEL
jgi:hypothetical protein